MCETIGHPIEQLTRVAIGPIRDPKLKVGHWRELTPDEVERLRKAAALTPALRARTTKTQRSPEDGKRRLSRSFVFFVFFVVQWMVHRRLTAIRPPRRAGAVPRAASARPAAPAARSPAPRPCPRPSADRSDRSGRTESGIPSSSRTGTAGRPPVFRPTILIRCRSSSVFSTPEVLTPRISAISTAVIGCLYAMTASVSSACTVSFCVDRSWNSRRTHSCRSERVTIW